MNIGEPRRTIHIEPIEEPVGPPVEPSTPAITPEPSVPPPNLDPEFTR
jgi:hypothetical protein